MKEEAHPEAAREPLSLAGRQGGSWVSHREPFHSLLNPSIPRRNKDVRGRSCEGAEADARLTGVVEMGV